MKLPISQRLLCCAALVPQGARVADIGCDHGYLGIELLKRGQAEFVHACDLRPMPLQSAVKNADRFGVADKMRFSCADGLSAVRPQEINTVVIAGMGGELIAAILEAAPWLQKEGYSLILQPQSQSHELRLRLHKLGYTIKQERLVEENGFIYTILFACYGTEGELAEGEEYCSQALYGSGDPLLSKYLSGIEKALSIRIEGILASSDPEGKGLAHWQKTREIIAKMKEDLLCRK